MVLQAQVLWPQYVRAAVVAGVLLMMALLCCRGFVAGVTDADAAAANALVLMCRRCC